MQYDLSMLVRSYQCFVNSILVSIVQFVYKIDLIRVEISDRIYRIISRYVKLYLYELNGYLILLWAFSEAQ